ncbi:fam-b protein [Plasmodium chabaudi chabaudi]|uniref:Fam-b protein n=1 Tax=Plasmodium chabaudi chabaudi TaxID=31271 RepID=A0A4V0K3L6_PLACU|nr:fam-b protein [Plasmodium chabaudi chabaudi]VTZ67139.1 fam-b protein [Plasmodium chabaudi chabaudi]|eukprot:XP_016653248.1 fam-b protein [Plasmodium chabaudi chabaudi]
MRVFILKLVFFSIIICSFEYAKNELYYVNERSIYLKSNVINFRSNRILADTDNQFDLNNFYESTLSLANQFSEYIDDVDDDEITNLRNDIASRIKSHKENKALPNLNNVDKKTRNLIHELQKELEKVKKEIDNIKNGELAIQPIHDRRIIKKDENVLGAKNEYNEITSSNNYKEFQINRKLKKSEKKIIVACLTFIVSFFALLALGGKFLLLALIPCVGFILKVLWDYVNSELKT